MFAISGNNASGYVKVVPGATTIYYVLVMTDRQYLNENNTMMMQILSSFRNR